MVARLRVVHVTATTPYARKLTCPDIQIVNGTTLSGIGEIPGDLTLRRLLDRRPFRWFDVLHLHHIEFDDINALQLILAECARSRRRVVFTAHDIDPIFTNRASYHAKLRTLVDWQVPLVCLTPTSASVLASRLGETVTTFTIPHGYVVAPGTVARGNGFVADGCVRYLMFGSLRRNRDIETVLYNWRFGHRQSASTLLLLLRAPGRINLAEDGVRWALISSMAGSEPRLQVEVMPYPTDAEVAQAASDCDALILPYRWGSHSGQLELAFDLGLAVAASSVGYLRDQYALHGGLVVEPVWFDWSDGAEYAYGARFHNALNRVMELVGGGKLAKRREEFAEHRRREHGEIISAYSEVYTRPWT